MRSLFGKKKKESPSPQSTIQNLNSQIELLTKKCEFLGKKIETELKSAKANATKNKSGISSYYKFIKKKFYKQK